MHNTAGKGAHTVARMPSSSLLLLLSPCFPSPVHSKVEIKNATNKEIKCFLLFSYLDISLFCPKQLKDFSADADL